MFGNEDHHWRVAARRRIIRKILYPYCPGDASSILEIGGGTGGNPELLAPSGEMSPDPNKINELPAELAFGR
jgi:hypothetical protein